MADKETDKKAEGKKTEASEPAKDDKSAGPPGVDPATVKKKDEVPVDPGMMHIKVYSPYQVYFDDQASSITAKNDTGPFDILPQHHKFLTLLTSGEMVIVTKKGEEKIKISRGVMYVKEDRVTVFLDI